MGILSRSACKYHFAAVFILYCVFCTNVLFMEGLTVPILTIAGFFFTALIWLGLRVMQNETKIAVGDSAIRNLEHKIEKFEAHVNAKFDKVFENLEQIKIRLK